MLVRKPNPYRVRSAWRVGWKNPPAFDAPAPPHQRDPADWWALFLQIATIIILITTIAVVADSAITHSILRRPRTMDELTAWHVVQAFGEFVITVIFIIAAFFPRLFLLVKARVMVVVGWCCICLNLNWIGGNQHANFHHSEIDEITTHVDEVVRRCDDIHRKCKEKFDRSKPKEQESPFCEPGEIIPPSPNSIPYL